jgi:dTMP kinase
MTVDSGAVQAGRRGRFIVFEGGDGAGKSTHVKMLVAALRKAGYGGASERPGLVVTREPGGTELGVRIRELLLHGDEIEPAAEALLYAADRAQHVAEVILPALGRGDVVISDRYLDSSIAYQVGGRGLAEAVIRQVNAVGTGGLEPDLTILMDIAPGIIESRRGGSDGALDRLERAGAAFHRKVIQRYRELAAAHPERYAVVNSSATKGKVHGQVLAAVSRVLETASPPRDAP